LAEDTGPCERRSLGTKEDYSNKNCLQIASEWARKFVAREIKQFLLLLVFNILEKHVRTEFEKWICHLHAVDNLKLLSNTDGTCKCSRENA
jgi:hypothetical protein